MEIERHYYVELLAEDVLMAPDTDILKKISQVTSHEDCMPPLGFRGSISECQRQGCGNRNNVSCCLGQISLRNLVDHCEIQKMD